jgi:hypothetical protein
MRDTTTAYLIFLALSCSACERGAPSAPNEDGVICVGASEAEARASSTQTLVFQGVVRALPADVASYSDWFIPSVHAYALEEELPVADALVELIAVDARGADLVDAPSLVTRTDAKGRYCLRPPTARPAGGIWVLRATTPAGVVMRQPAMYAFDADINAASEALVVVLGERGVDLVTLDERAWLDLRTIADTAVGLMAEVRGEGKSQGGLISDMKKALVEDERLKKRMEREAR